MEEQRRASGCVRSMIKQVTIDQHHVQFTFSGSEQESAQLRKQIMTQCVSTAIHSVTFYNNTSQFTNEKIAHRLGLCVLQHQEGAIGTLKIGEPKKVTTDDIQGLTFYSNTLLFELNQHETIHCQMVVKSGTGKEHQKWNAVAAMRFKESDDGIVFDFNLTGRLTWEEIILQIDSFSKNNT